jgi:oxygen-dependent protoporphyrinogen oxidase
LGLVKDMTFTYRTEPAAKNRFIYYPDQLNRLPAEAPSFAELFALWRSGIMAGVFGMVMEPMKPTRSVAITDETIGSFLERRVDKRIANNLVSAVFHGIYAGDIWQLSAKTLMSMAWHLEGRYGSALGGFFKMQSEDPRQVALTLAHPYDIDTAKALNEEIDLDLDFAKNLKDASTFTFKNGLQELSRALQKSVEDKGNVDVKIHSPVQSMKPVGNETLQIAVTTGVRPHPYPYAPTCTNTSDSPKLLRPPKTLTSWFLLSANPASPPSSPS